MQSGFAQPPAPKLLAATPTEQRLYGSEEVEKDCRRPVLISRCPGYLDEVERDMKRITPTTPGSSSSSFPPTPPTSGSSTGAGSRPDSIQGLKSRAPRVVPSPDPTEASTGSEGGGGGGGSGCHSHSSSSSLGSLSSPTDSQGSGGGGVVNVAPQGPLPASAHRPVSSEQQFSRRTGGRVESGLVGGGPGDVAMERYNAQLKTGDSWRHNQQSGGPGGQGGGQGGQWGHGGQGGQDVEGVGGQGGHQPLTLPEDSRQGQRQGYYGAGQVQPLGQGQGYGHAHSWQGHRGRPSEQSFGEQSAATPSYQRQTLVPSASQTLGYQGQYPPESQRMDAGLHDYRGNVTGHEYRKAVGGELTSLGVGVAGGENLQSFVHPSHLLSQPHPSHPQAPPSSLTYVQYPHHHHHHHHHAQPQQRHAHLYSQHEIPQPLSIHGSGRWSQHQQGPHPHSLDSFSQSGSDFTPSDVQYQPLGGVGSSQEHLLSSSYSSHAYSSHTHSSLGSLSELGEQQYGFQTSLRPVSLGYDPPNERCHSFPLTQSLGPRQEPLPSHLPQHVGGAYLGQGHQGHHYQLPHHRNYNTSSVSRQYPAMAAQETLSREFSDMLSFSEDIPGGQSIGSGSVGVVNASDDIPSGQSEGSGPVGVVNANNSAQDDRSVVGVVHTSEETPTGEGAGGVASTKQALLTLLDSDRLDIVEQPRDTRVGPHSKTVLICRARALDSEATPSQQWYRGEEPLSGETGPELVLAEVGGKEVGLYYCLITHPEDRSARKCSDVVQVAFRTTAATSEGTATTEEEEGQEEEEPKEPVILEQPAARIFSTIGEDLKLELRVKGEAPLSFKWYKDSRELDYAKGPALVIPGAVYADSGQYCCTVTNTHGSRLSGSFDVQVNRIKVDTRGTGSQGKGQAPTPTSQFSWEGGSISDSFLREVSLAITQQISNWKKLVTYLGLAHSDLLEVRSRYSRPEEHALMLLCRWRDKYHEGRGILRKRLERSGVDFESLENSVPGGQVQGVEHMVVAKPRITVQPQSQEAVSGQEFSLSVEVDSSSSSGPSPSTSSYQCSFQWFKNYSHLHGKTDPKLLIASAVESDTGEYYCTAFNKGGSTDSDIAFVKVSNPHPCPLVLEGAPPTHRGLSYWSTGEGARNPKVPSLGNRSVSVGGVSGVRIGQFGGAGGVEGVIRAGFVGEISRPRSWAEEGGVLGGAGLGVGLPPVEGLIGRSGSISGGGGGRRVGSSYLTRKGSGASGVLDPALSGSEGPRILVHPQSQTVDAGDPLTLSCVAAGQGELTYLWYFNGLSLQSENRPEYFLNCFTDEDEGVYYCKVSNYWGDINSDMAHVQMKDN